MSKIAQKEDSSFRETKKIQEEISPPDHLGKYRDCIVTGDQQRIIVLLLYSTHEVLDHNTVFYSLHIFLENSVA